jgi:hypothetical protein
MDQRVPFIADWLRNEWTMAELATRYAISRKTAYKWIDLRALHGTVVLAACNPQEIDLPVRLLLLGGQGCQRLGVRPARHSGAVPFCTGSQPDPLTRPRGRWRRVPNG